MQIIAPDLLVEMRDLPLAALASVTAIGLAIWSTGWWTHRFWIALAATLGAGIEGLRSGAEFGLHPMAAGLLAAIAAGCIGLALGRVVVFVIYGIAVWYLVHKVGPQFEVPLACFLVGGLLSVLFYRLCVMLLMSALGALLLAYSGLVLAENFVRFDAVQLVSDNPVSTVNSVFGFLIVIGLAAQHFAGKAKDWYLARRQAWLEFLKKQQSNKSAPPKFSILKLFQRQAKAA
ncbi:MAG: hypothetical protein NZM31_00075 [Gemmatales bacterium]|nr:hypothetical protein [Gemmatales bacterium]MDW8385389.1 hypothetical protein [Gemmatales bacterium]